MNYELWVMKQKEDGAKRNVDAKEKVKERDIWKRRGWDEEKYKHVANEWWKSDEWVMNERWVMNDEWAGELESKRVTKWDVKRRTKRCELTPQLRIII